MFFLLVFRWCVFVAAVALVCFLLLLHEVWNMMPNYCSKLYPELAHNRPFLDTSSPSWRKIVGTAPKKIALAVKDSLPLLQTYDKGCARLHLFPNMRTCPTVFKRVGKLILLRPRWTHALRYSDTSTTLARLTAHTRTCATTSCKTGGH